MPNEKPMPAFLQEIMDMPDDEERAAAELEKYEELDDLMPDTEIPENKDNYPKNKTEMFMPKSTSKSDQPASTEKKKGGKRPIRDNAKLEQIYFELTGNRIDMGGLDNLETYITLVDAGVSYAQLKEGYTKSQLSWVREEFKKRYSDKEQPMPPKPSKLCDEKSHQENVPDNKPQEKPSIKEKLVIPAIYLNEKKDVTLCLLAGIYDLLSSKAANNKDVGLITLSSMLQEAIKDVRDIFAKEV